MHCLVGRAQQWRGTLLCCSEVDLAIRGDCERAEGPSSRTLQTMERTVRGKETVRAFEETVVLKACSEEGERETGIRVAKQTAPKQLPVWHVAATTDLECE